MPWLHFTATYDFIPKPAVTIRYPAGYVGLVTTPCANRAVAAGKAERLPTPNRVEAKNRCNGKLDVREECQSD